MAYLSREFWKPDDRRLGLAGPASASAASGPDTGVAIGSAGAPPGPATGQGDPGAIRSFFEANRDQGGKILGGLADSLNSRFTDASGKFESTANPFPADWAGGYLLPHTPEWQAQQRATAQQASDAADAASARNLAGVEPLESDVSRFGGGVEGQQSLLEQKYASSPYTPGQARLDAWLSGAAANANPSVAGAPRAGYEALKTSAANAPRAGWTPNQKYLMQYFLTGKLGG